MTDQGLVNVVINHEEQYSIWPKDRDVPKGWKVVGKTRTKDEALQHIEEIWTDMRPLSLREKVDELRQGLENQS